MTKYTINRCRDLSNEAFESLVLTKINKIYLETEDIS